MLRIFLVAACVSCVTCDFMGFFGSKKDSEGSGNARVVGGEEAKERIPYQISLQMQKKEGGGNPGFFGGIMQIMSGSNNRNFSHFCGGSVLNENHIVTAAHW